MSLAPSQPASSPSPPGFALHAREDTGVMHASVFTEDYAIQRIQKLFAIIENLFRSWSSTEPKLRGAIALCQRELDRTRHLQPPQPLAGEKADFAALVLWYQSHVLFAESTLLFWAGEWRKSFDGYRAILARLKPRQSADLYFSTHHQLACIEVIHGKESGLQRLTQLVRHGLKDPRYRSPATLFTFSEVLRHFHGRESSHPVIDRFVADWREGSGTVTDAASSSEAPPDWRTLNQALRSALVAEVRRLLPDESVGFGDLTPRLVPEWEETLPPPRNCFQCGVLSMVAAPEIRYEFLQPDAGAQEQHRQFQNQWDQVRSLAERQLLDAALTVAKKLRAELLPVKSSPDDQFADLFQLVDQECRRLQSALTKREVNQQTQLDTEVFEKLEDYLRRGRDLKQAKLELTRLKGLSGAERWSGVVEATEAMLRSAEAEIRSETDKAEWRRVRQELETGQYEEARLRAAKLGQRQLNAVDEFIARQRADGSFQAGSECVVENPAQAEAHFVEASQNDRDGVYMQPIAVLQVAARMYRAHCEFHPQHDGVKTYVRSMTNRLARIWRDHPISPELNALAWGELEKLCIKLLSVAPVESDGSKEVVASMLKGLKRQVDRHRWSVPVLESLGDMLVRIRQHDLLQVRLGSRAEQLQTRVSYRLFFSRGNIAMCDGTFNGDDGAIRNLSSAISVSPQETEAWSLLADCVIRQNDTIPAHKKADCLKRVDRHVQELCDRFQNANNDAELETCRTEPVTTISGWLQSSDFWTDEGDA